MYRSTWAAIGILGNLEAGEAYLGSHRNTWECTGNTWAATGILGNFEAVEACLGSHRNWECIGICGQQ